jgi:hypothetical protein
MSERPIHLEEKLIHTRESRSHIESVDKKRGRSVMLRRNGVKTLLVVLTMSIIALFGLSSPASAAPATKPQSIVTTAYVTGNPPTEDCLGMASFVLGGLAARAGAAAWTIGEGAIQANLGSVLGYIGGVTGSYRCLNYLAPAYINSICQQSHGALFNYHTMWARALVFFATRGHKTLC